MIESTSMTAGLNQQRNDTQLNANQLDVAKRAKVRAEQDDAALEDKQEAVDAFQMLLATQLVKEMRKTLPDGLFGGGSGSDVYESWFDQHIAGALSDSDALGLAGMLKVAIGMKEKQAEGEAAQDELAHAELSQSASDSGATNERGIERYMEERAVTQ